MKTQLTTLALLCTVCVTSQAADWPAWRGPTGMGLSDEKDIPVKWNSEDHVKWKVPLANQGNSTPIVSGDRIFLTQANKGGSVRSLLCFNRSNGKKLWQRDVAYGETEKNWNASWYANASPVTDGELVVVTFGSAGMFCYDFSGKQLWKRTDLGKWEHAFGNGSSPVLYGNLAIQWCGPNQKAGRNYLLAVNKHTGKTVWEHDEKAGSWGTPLLIKADGKDQLLLATTPALKAFDPKTGKEIWHCHGLTKYVYNSPLYAKGVAVAMSGYGGAALAVKTGGTGDITGDRLWLHPKNTQRVGTGTIVGDHIYVVNENGIPYCYELKTGKQVWNVRKRPGAGKTWGSMVYADGRLYVLMRNGKTLVFAAKPEYELIAVNSLGLGVLSNSSIVISNGEIFIRTFKHLWCISKK